MLCITFNEIHYNFLLQFGITMFTYCDMRTEIIGGICERPLNIKLVTVNARINNG